jgi:hypothetical protein
LYAKEAARMRDEADKTLEKTTKLFLEQLNEQKIRDETQQENGNR